MTNSYRRLPFVGYCGGSQKKDKQHGNRAMRRTNHVLLQKDPEAVLRTLDEVLDPWSMAQDGTRHYRPFSASRLEYRDWYRWAKAK